MLPMSGSRSLSLFGILVVGAICGGSVSADAAMRFCNRTQQPLEAALGYHRDEKDQSARWVSEGWWRLEAGQCARVYDQPLAQRFYYYFGRALTPSAPGRQPNLWEGKYQFCVEGKAFRIEGDAECETRGFQVRGFRPVDIGADTKDYTLEFKDQP